MKYWNDMVQDQELGSSMIPEKTDNEEIYKRSFRKRDNN